MKDSDWTILHELYQTPNLTRADGTPLVRRTWLVRCPKARPLSAAAQAFIHYLEEAAQ